MSGNFQAIAKKLNENKNIVMIKERYVLCLFTWMEKYKEEVFFCTHNESQFRTIDKLPKQ